MLSIQLNLSRCKKFSFGTSTSEKNRDREGDCLNYIYNLLDMAIEVILLLCELISHKEVLSRSQRQWDSASSGTLLLTILDFFESSLRSTVFSNVFARSVISLLGYAASNEMGRQAAEILFDPDTDYDEVHSILGDGETIPYHRQLAALSDALGVAVRVVFLDTRLDRLGRPSPFHRDFSPTTHHWKIPRWSRKTFPPDPISLDEVRYTRNAARCVATSSSSGHRRAFVTLLYRPGGAAEADHYDILYPKLNVIPGSSLGHADAR
ncbi:hypothetical protein OPV22_019399 [Ensete ventricosum]|uniref:Ubiquitinyl hydrolase 1 n=1 Tax=Ensete ventricosum TaxID=4639 RepID=A0AAV8QKV7_ENSVE|nr:hypothetical protein OPV22_019399 [Ensete ventricosum]